ncbi:flagellar C1a complex subunit C1a-32-domain-containing protein [Cladochytrium replicatum]|nr:flagellar C1a complex subunit C1a-32-domain-containing protein [Cladochytrium replicatum]
MNDKTAILMDFLYYLLSFAKENGLTPPQASAFFSIMLETHERCTETSFINLAEDFDFFKTLLLQHSVNRPPYSQKVFSLDDLKLITDYALNTYES